MVLIPGPRGTDKETSGGDEDVAREAGLAHGHLAGSLQTDSDGTGESVPLFQNFFFSVFVDFDL